MSGTSMDGLDVAYATFRHDRGAWTFALGPCQTVPYSPAWQQKLGAAPTLSGLELSHLNVALGQWMGQTVQDFVGRFGVRPDFVASHGHTVFHDPAAGLTLQIGQGQALARAAGLPVVANFREQDVALGGQGAPLVPVGDALLFDPYEACLNLGGIANISLKQAAAPIKAFDIGACNLVLNRLAGQLGHAYDAGGRLAASGQVMHDLLEALNQLPYYALEGPKSLGQEWVEQHLWPVLAGVSASPQDLLATYVEHLAGQIARSVRSVTKVKQLLVTGGGAHNTFLIKRLKANINAQVVVPGTDVVDYKEALIFAFLGVLRLRGLPNIWCSVTGAQQDHCSGQVYAGPQGWP